MMSEIILKGNKEDLDLLLKKERIWLKRHDVNIVSVEKPERKKRSPNKSNAEKLEDNTYKK